MPVYRLTGPVMGQSPCVRPRQAANLRGRDHRDSRKSLQLQSFRRDLQRGDQGEARGRDGSAPALHEISAGPSCHGIDPGLQEESWNQSVFNPR